MFTVSNDVLIEGQAFALNFDFCPNAPVSPVVPGFGLTTAPLFNGYVGGGMYQVNFDVSPVPAGLPRATGYGSNRT